MVFKPIVSRKVIYFALVLILSVVICKIPVASADEVIQTYDLDSSGPPPSVTRMLLSAAAVPVQNADGSFTFTQTVNGSSTAPYYTVPTSGGGFAKYSYYNQDFGWMHDFPAWNTPGLSIQSATLLIRAYDIDSEVFNGQNGEYDGVSVDGTQLNPGYLQGTNNTWSNTTFNIPVTNIMDNGKINVWLDIDMHHNYQAWATTLDSSVLTITYRIDNNKAPYQPELSQLPSGTVHDNDDLVINVAGPQPADPDAGDSVHYTYKWFVDVGTGGFVDDEFAGRNDHTGNKVPAADTRIGDKWRVQVTPVDNHNAIGPFSTATWAPITATPVDQPPVVTATPDRAPNAYGWYNSDVTVQFNATDTDQTPVKQIDAPVLVTTDGANQIITGKAVDTAGLQGTASVSINLDKTAPVTAAVPINTGWVNHEVTVQLSATDLLSGVDKTYFSLDGGAPQASTSVVITDEGSHTLTYWSEDFAGNTELTHTTAVQIDKTAPITKTDAPADWIHQDITVQLAATDNQGGSGIAGIYYSLDGGPQQTGTEVQVSGEGTHSLVYWSVDNVGNTETQHTTIIRIDKTAPITTVDVPSGWVNHDVTVAMSAADQDNGSGVAATTFTIDGGAEQAGNSVNITTEGVHPLTYWSTDNAGNVESKHTASIQIDKTDPITEASINGNPSLNGWYSSNPTVTLSASDNLSGVAKTLYRINSNAWTDYTQPFTVVTEGTNHIEYKSVDNAGNEETEKTLNIQLDKTAPTINVVLDKTSLFPPNHQLVTVHASVYSSDTTSDIDSVVLTSITSNEPDNGLGDGDTKNDIQDAQYGTLDTSFNLRAERSGNGSGRVYTITYTATDKAGNQTIVKVTVTVPHNKK
jgi:hypothetical protein